MLRKTLILFLFFVLPLIGMFAQRGYVIIDDTTKYVNVKIVEGGSRKNAVECQIQRGGQELIKYGPDEASEYGFYDGSSYVSREFYLNGKRANFFLEQLEAGELTLYYLVSDLYTGFLLEKDDQLTVLPKMSSSDTSFNDILKRYHTECYDVDHRADLVRYNRFSLQRYVNWYNYCIDKPFPEVRYGLGFGSGTGMQELHFGMNYYMIGILEIPEQTVWVRILMEIPLVADVLSFQPELFYARSALSFSGAYEFAQIEYTRYIDYQGRSNAIHFPMLLKCALPLRKWQPYFEFGYSPSIRFMNSNSFYQTSVTDGLVTLEYVSHENNLPRFSHGYTVGAGISLPCNKSFFIASGIRFSQAENNTLVLPLKSQSMLFHVSLYYH